jgi:AraC-like DNA-binding protein
MGAKGTRGILNPHLGLTQFALEREPSPPDLAPFVARFWRVSWVIDGEPFEQEILPNPCVNLSYGAEGFEVHGPGTRRFVAHLTGRGRVFGTTFTPAGFAAFARVPMRALVDAVLSVEAATGRDAPPLTDDEPATVRAAIEGFLRGFAPKLDEDAELVDRLVTTAQEDRNICRAEDLAALADLSVRSLHRLFSRYVGVGPKWVVRRSRVQEAADRVAREEHVDWARTAQELGYHDQAHLIRDFRAQVGFTPSAYARRCAAARGAIRRPRIAT